MNKLNWVKKHLAGQKGGPAYKRLILFHNKPKDLREYPGSGESVTEVITRKEPSMARPKLTEILREQEEWENQFEDVVEYLFCAEDDMTFIWTGNPWRWIILFRNEFYDWEENPYDLDDYDKDDETSSQIKHEIQIEEKDGKYQYRFELQYMESHQSVNPTAIPRDFFHSEWVELDRLLPIIEDHWGDQDFFWEELGCETS